MFRNFQVKRYRDHAVERVVDSVATEEPLSIQIVHWRKSARVSENLAVTMRSPGADRELAVGLLVSEGVINNFADIREARSLGSEPSNEVLVELAPEVDFESWKQLRRGFVSSSCGVCGKASADQIMQDLPLIAPGGWRVKPGFVESFPRLLENSQTTFNQTGGVHAASFISLEGTVKFIFEDVGRHNALDKLIGHALFARELPLGKGVIFMSSRSSFELIQKAAMAGAQVLASVGSPSSLAIETARSIGLTLICFVRERRFNVYSGDWRIDWD